MRFSILTPVYNVEKYLRDCVDSVLGQSFGDFELILVDDGSTDRSGELCDEYAQRDSRIKVFHKPNGGLPHTRSYGIERASGDYYVFLDSDDYIERDALETLDRNIAASDCDCVLYGYKLIKDGAVFQTVQCDESYCGQVTEDKRLVFNILLNNTAFNAIWRKCTRAACFDGRDYSPYYHITIGEDLVRSTEILENAKSFLFIQDVLYNYNFNSSSVTHTIDYDNRRPASGAQLLVLDMLEKTGVFEKEDYDRLRNGYLDIVVIELRRLARRCSSKKAAYTAMERLYDDPLYKRFLSVGYKKAPRLFQQTEVSTLNRLLYRITIALFRRRRFGAIVALDTLMCRVLRRSE